MVIFNGACCRREHSVAFAAVAVASAFTVAIAATAFHLLFKGVGIYGFLDVLASFEEVFACLLGIEAVTQDYVLEFVDILERAVADLLDIVGYYHGLEVGAFECAPADLLKCLRKLDVGDRGALEGVLADLSERLVLAQVNLLEVLEAFERTVADLVNTVGYDYLLDVVAAGERTGTYLCDTIGKGECSLLLAFTFTAAGCGRYEHEFLAHYITFLILYGCGDDTGLGIDFEFILRIIRNGGNRIGERTLA